VASARIASTLAVIGTVTGALLVAALLHERRPALPEGSNPRRPEESLARLAVAVEPTVARRVERIRGLRFETIPRPRIISADRFRRLSERDARRPRFQHDLAAGEVEAKLVGFVDPGEDLSSLPADTAELAAAAYDPRARRLYVIRDAVSGGRALVEFVLAHELTHALEDQRFGLEEPEGSSDDRALAELALNEGTATAVMTEYARRHLSALELAGATLGLDSSTEGVPDFLLEQLLFAYLRGAAFVERLYASAAGWNVVDITLRHGGPASTEQVLHPRKLLRAEGPLPVPPGPRPGPGWQRADGGSVGELTTRQLLELALPAARARTAAAGWGGDRYTLWRRRGAPLACNREAACHQRFALVVAWRWDTTGDERQFVAALRRYLRSIQAGMPAAIGVRAGTVRLALAPSEPLARRLSAELE
jgi:hypothetical protein